MPPTNRKFHATPNKISAPVKFKSSIPVVANTALTTNSAMPEYKIFNTPKRPINVPVKNDGTNIASTCH